MISLPQMELSEEQRAAVDHDGHSVVASVAGSGKTTVLIHKVGRLLIEGVQPKEILLLTFGKKVADEMAARMGKLLGPGGARVQARTFHSFGLAVTRKHGNRIARGLSEAKILKEMDINFSLRRALMQSADALGLPYLTKWQDGQPPQLRIPHARNYCSAMQDLLFDPHDDPLDPNVSDALARSGCYHSPEERHVLHETFRVWTAEKLQQPAMTYDDMITHAITILEMDPAILEAAQRAYSYVLVDEYQDTNPAQQRLVELISEQAELTLVGDDDQSIFSFRRANPSLMISMTQSPDFTVHKLQTNFRSGDEILEAANKLIAHNKERIQKRLIGIGTEGEIEVVNHPTTYSEAYWVADEVEMLVKKKGVLPHDIMVLFRTNAQLGEIADVFLSRQIPIQLPAGMKAFHELPEVQDVEAYLRLIIDSTDDAAFDRIVNRPPRGISRNVVQSIEEEARRHSISMIDAANSVSLHGVRNASWVRDNLDEFEDYVHRWQNLHFQGESTHSIIGSVLADTHYESWIKKEGDEEDNYRAENLSRCCSIADRHADPEEFLERLSQMRKSKGGKKTGRVVLSTIHRAKGLESEVVFLVGCRPGRLPHARAMDITEERRLCYVAVTRAKRKLFISYDTEQTKFKAHDNPQSTNVDFLREMGLLENGTETPTENRDAASQLMRGWVSGDEDE